MLQISILEFKYWTGPSIEHKTWNDVDLISVHITWLIVKIFLRRTDIRPKLHCYYRVEMDVVALCLNIVVVMTVVVNV